METSFDPEVALDSSCGFTGALASGGRIVWSGVLAPSGRHAEESALPNLLRVLAEHRCAIGAVRRWTVGVGPGSFTGLRSGIAMVEGICRATGAWMRGIPSSLALARQAVGSAPVGTRIAVLHDARRDQIITTVYRVVGPGDLEEIEAARIYTRRDVARASSNWECIATPHFRQIEPRLPAEAAARCQAPEGVDPRWFLVAPHIPWSPDTADRRRSCTPIYVRPPVFVAPTHPGGPQAARSKPGKSTGPAEARTPPPSSECGCG